MKSLEFQQNHQPFLMTEAPKSIRIITCLVTIFYYLLTKFLLKEYLPEKWFADSSRMYSMMDNTSSINNSFASTGRLFSLFPLWSHDILVAIIGITVVIVSFRAIRTWRGLLLNSLIMFPLLLLGLLAPSKETIVFLITLIIMFLYRFSNKVLFCGVVCLYLSYGYFVRIYFLMILFVWVGMMIATKLPRILTLFFMLLAFCAFFLLPEKVYFTLQSARDNSYQYSEYIIFSNNRTSFPNPFPPDGPLHFLGNYVYAFFVLHLPFILFISPKEILLFLNILAYAWLIYNAFKKGSPKSRMITKLFLSHIAVLMLFEPDFGSYFRHFSSIYLYLVPIFSIIERKKVVLSKNNEDSKKTLPAHADNWIKL